MEGKKEGRPEAGRNLILTPDTIIKLKVEMGKRMMLFKSCAQQAKQKKWDEFYGNMRADTTLKTFWRFHQSMNGIASRSGIPDFQTSDQILKKSDEEKGHAFLERYIEQTDQGDKEERLVIMEKLSELCVNAESIESLTVTCDIIQATLKRSLNSAPGPDGIRYSDIKNLTDDDMECLASELNESIQNGTIREEWLHSTLVPLKKPGKNHKQINGYRIITMQNTTGKLIEKIMARELSYKLEEMHIFPPTLGGCRRNKETWCNAAVFAYDVFEGFHDGVETFAATIDLEDAYNRVPFEKLIQTLLQFSVDPIIVRWIAADLIERKVALRCSSWSSTPISVCPGLPQGSPLSPVLFNVYTAAVTQQQLDGRGRTLSFVDDILVYRQGRDRLQVAKAVQEELDRLSAWCEDSGARVNHEKATATWFSLNTHICKTPTPIITLDGNDIERTSTMRYLGIEFDRSLCFREHIDHVIARARRGLAAMRVMAAANIPQGQLVTLYQALVLSGIEYGCGILTLSETQTERLDRIQNEAMRLILGCTRDTPCVTMRYLLDFPTMAQRINLWRARAYLRVCSDTQHPLHQELGTRKGNRLKRGKSWMGRAQDVIRPFCAPNSIDLGEEWIPVPREFKEIFSTVITLDRSCREQNPIAVQAEVMALIAENSESDDAVIFTDGSVIRNQRCAWAFTARSGGKIVTEDSGAFAATTSSLTMEVMAVTKAFIWLESQNFSRASILSDSMNMIQKVQNGAIRRQWLESITKSKLSKVTFIFVPGHAGVLGNERADQLAADAVIAEGQPMDRGDILNAVKESARREDFGDVDAPAITRMQDMGLKVGVARKESHTRPGKSTINQHRTGTISHTTLTDILKRRPEHLWTCPTCDDGNLI
jgi:ribonuclease HI